MVGGIGAPTPDLEYATLAKFDNLVATGAIIWGPSDPEYRDTELPHDIGLLDNIYDFPVEFRVAPAFSNRLGPVPSYVAGNSKPPSFIGPDPVLVAARIGETHTLAFSKFCVLRPHFVLYPNQFERHSPELTGQDLHAAWQVLKAFPRTPLMMIHNYGSASGGLRGHKHMEVFPKPGSSGDVVSVPTVPYENHIIALSAQTSPEDLEQKYNNIVSLAAQDLVFDRRTSYNVVMTKDWIMAIARKCTGLPGLEVDAAGMIGMVWVGSEEEKEAWIDMGPINYLELLGIPPLQMYDSLSLDRSRYRLDH
ncbi:hypothetical protein TWF192_001560 [Orbilia oligospora]|uniref:Uncharacterized protein n=1 Tax=Orbilia oligospora TaxID=2813651 RepID=A0A6G1LTU2_ORBOL|nr:hypothetical protein TWF191_009411 [Orbilia oligospora]KAF3222532.1 hypothetical protein TWF679_006002 [Orbilia oligospora]KAF3234327.1 hypothetical protein TWF192_001560 [Orbilia oligospora]